MTTELKTTAAERAAGPRPWPMLLVLLVGQFMGLLDLYIVNVALPAIGTDLHASGAALQLIIGGYIVAYAMLLITGARLGELYGRRRMYLLGLIGFTFSSLICGLAPDAGVLVVFRLAQGGAAALMIPQIISVIQTRFTGTARARALSAYAAVLSIGSVAGLALGGVLVSADVMGTSWRPAFLVNVPLGIVLAALVPRLMPADGPRGGRGLDLAGLATALPGTLLIVFPLVVGREAGWPAWTFVSIAIGVSLAIAFVALERRIAARGGDPLLNLDVLRADGMPSGLITLIALMISYGGFLFTFALHLQQGLGQSPLRAAMTFLPMAGAFGVASYYWRALPRRVHRLLPAIGLVVSVLGLLALAASAGDGILMWIALPFYGAGLGLAISLLSHSLVHVPPQRAADASGLLTTTMQLGQLTGVAAFGTVFLALADDPGSHPISTTAMWLAVAALTGLISAVSLARAVASSSAIGSP